MAQRALGTRAGVVHQAIDRPKFFAHALHQVCNAFYVREIEGYETQRSSILGFAFFNRGGEFAAFFACNRDGPKASVTLACERYPALFPGSRRSPVHYA